MNVWIAELALTTGIVLRVIEPLQETHDLIPNISLDDEGLDLQAIATYGILGGDTDGNVLVCASDSTRHLYKSSVSGICDHDGVLPCDFVT